jgi:hypothetical protein
MRHNHPLAEIAAELFGDEHPFNTLFGAAHRGRLTTVNGLSAVVMDIPGRSREHLKVFTQGGKLHIKVAKVGVRPAIEETYLLREQHDPRKVKASLKDGVLTVTVGNRQSKDAEPEHSVPID